MGQKPGKHVKKDRAKIPPPVEDSDDEIDGAPVVTTNKHVKKDSKKMPFFRKQSEQCRKRLDHQQWLAQENPEPVFDLSHCEISEVPSGVFALCKVLQKETLLLHDNWLSTLQPATELATMNSLRVLDCHTNEMRTLPDEIGRLSSLQVLNLENNRLTRLPTTIGQLTHLQTLNLKGNKIKELPSSICEMKSLRMLDIRDNRILMLPKELCKVRTLETLSLDALDMSYPSIGVCSSGTESIMKFLCSECGIEYLPPSNFLLNVLDPPKSGLSSPNREALEEEENLERSIAGYSDMMERKRLERIELERRFLEHQEEQAQLALMSQINRDQMLSIITAEENKLDKVLMSLREKAWENIEERKRLERIELERRFLEHQEEQAQLALMSQMNRDQMLSIITAEENKLDEELDKLAHEKERNRVKLVQDLQAVENGADDLIKTLLDMNAKARKTEALLDEIEQERIRENKLFEVNWEEIQNLRRKEVLDAMEKSLQEADMFETLRQNFTNEKEFALNRALLDEEMMSNAQINSVLEANDKNMTILLDDLARQELLQKEAFEALQLQKDVKHQRITNQIGLIQEELANLTAVEIEKRGQRTEDELNRLAEKRITLIELLSQLMLEQDKRQIELRKRLQKQSKEKQLYGQSKKKEEMEQQRLDGQADYWLVQFQRLMDQKPQALIDREQNLEICIIKILEKSNAHDYIPLFARHRISIETLLQMTEEDLKQMGIYELGIRRDILRNVEAYRNEASNTGKFVDLEKEPAHPDPTAPPMEEFGAARQVSVTARGLNSECSICLEKVSEVVFLNCGHVCTCIECSVKVTQCPLCRADIFKRVKLIPTQIGT